jgi:branched-chain amino acid transport system substrate-binding protein
MSKEGKVFSLMVLLVALIFVMPALSWGQGKKPIKVGFPAPLSGSSAGWGESMVQGTVLAIEELNASGGILGHPLELIKGDVEDQEPSTVISVVRKLINRDKVNIMVTGAANPSCVEYPIMQQSKMPYLLFAYSQSHERIFKENPGKYTYIHNCTTTYEPYKVEFANLERKLEEEGKFKPINRKLAVIKSQNAYSIYCGDGLKETFKSRGWNVVIDETIPYGGRFMEFAPILAKIRDLKPAIILYTDHTSANAASFLLDFIQDPTPSLVYLQATPSYPDFKKIMNESYGLIPIRCLGRRRRSTSKNLRKGGGKALTRTVSLIMMS